MTDYAARIAGHLQALGIDPGYAAGRGLRPCEEPAEVVLVGLDIFGRAVHLERTAATAWHAMRDAARADGVELLLVSAFRGVDYQRAIFDRKLARGIPIEDILRVNAAPGYSEHHTGRAVDIATPGCPPLTEAFEATDACAWLTAHAGGFGFEMTYPRDNPHGFVYEPWHWCLRHAGARADATATPQDHQPSEPGSPLKGPTTSGVIHPP